MQFNFTLKNGYSFVVKAIKWRKSLLIVVYKLFVTFSGMLHVQYFLVLVRLEWYFVHQKDEKVK